MPIFVSGGITFDNLPSLMALGISGVAIVSGIMKSEDPKLAAGKYKQFFSKTPDKF
jgi:thiamine-phosphate pyrophosphorylase